MSYSMLLIGCVAEHDVSRISFIHHIIVVIGVYVGVIASIQQLMGLPLIGNVFVVFVTFACALLVIAIALRASVFNKPMVWISSTQELDIGDVSGDCVSWNETVDFFPISSGVNELRWEVLSKQVPDITHYKINGMNLELPAPEVRGDKYEYNIKIPFTLSRFKRYTLQRGLVYHKSFVKPNEWYSYSPTMFVFRSDIRVRFPVGRPSMFARAELDDGFSRQDIGVLKPIDFGGRTEIRVVRLAMVARNVLKIHWEW
ncbi:MAG TPA: hypothetical protein VK176_11000 [Phycisphaerales bacterium]|nr:hypothetical protein [Phycisphaerales bacterium]